MAAILSPSSQLGFNRPLTRTVTKTLTVSNPNEYPIAFKVKTTAPKLYCVRPNSGRIEPGGSVEVAVILQAMREEPPLSTKCKDKFLVQTTGITGARASKPLSELWTSTDEDPESKIHQQKIKVAYLPPEGQALSEGAQEETFEHPSTLTSEGDLSRFDTVREPSGTNGTHISAPEAQRRTVSPSPPLDRPNSPGEYLVAQEETTTTIIHEPIEEPAPPPPAPIPVPAPAPAPAPEAVPEPIVEPISTPAPSTIQRTIATTSLPELDDLSQRYAEALGEIERLQQALIAAQQAAAQQAAVQPVGVRRRTTRVLSEDGESVNGNGSEDGTLVDSVLTSGQPDGVPVQVVAGIALAVFLATYLFF